MERAQKVEMQRTRTSEGTAADRAAAGRPRSGPALKRSAYEPRPHQIERSAPCYIMRLGRRGMLGSECRFVFHAVELRALNAI
jgi:hypothetical protein